MRPVTDVQAGTPSAQGKTVMRVGSVPVVRATQTLPVPASASAGGKTLQAPQTALPHVPVRVVAVLRAQPTPVVPFPT